MIKYLKRLFVFQIAVVLLCVAGICTVAMASDDGLKNEMGPQKIMGKWDFAWPAPGCTQLTSCFYDNRGHYAIDLGTADNIVAMYDGEVVYAKWVSGYGWSVMLKHNYVTTDNKAMTLYSHYGHLSTMKVKAAAEGKKPVTVKKGDVIGVAGNTGGDYPVHLDFTILTAPDVSPEGRKAYALDPFHNMLLPPPSGLKGSDYSKSGGCNCKPYVSDVLAFYKKNKDVVYYDTIDSTPRIAKSIKNANAADTCRLQSMPYDAEKYFTGKLEKGTIVYLQGAVKNKHNNIWYKTENGKFIYSGDLEILEDNAIIKSETKFGAVGVSKNKECYLKDKPYEASVHSASVAKGKTVEIVAKVTNSYNNTWYKTSDGKFIYSGDLDVYECNKMFDITAKFTNTEWRKSRVAPYQDSPSVDSYSKGEVVSVTRFVTNSYGNIWAQLTDGSYLCFHDYDANKTKLTYKSSTFTKKSVDGPTGDRELGTACNLTGKITSTVPILTMTGYVENRETGKKTVPAVVVKMKNGTTTANINSTSNTVDKVNLNNKLVFQKITTAGHYCYRVTLQLGFTDTKSGKTFKLGDEQAVVSMNFTAGNPKPLKEQGVRGDVNNDGKINLTDLLQLLRYMNNPSVSINKSNADMNGDGKIALLDLLLLLRKINS